MHQICNVFYSILKKWSKLGQKNYFLAHFQRCLAYAILHPMNYAPIFCQMKLLLVTHNCGMVLGPFLLQYDLHLLEFSPEVVYNETKTVCETNFKIRCLRGNGTCAKFWSISGPNLRPENRKYGQKTKLPQKLHFQGHQIVLVPNCAILI